MVGRLREMAETGISTTQIRRSNLIPAGWFTGIKSQPWIGLNQKEHLHIRVCCPIRRTGREVAHHTRRLELAQSPLRQRSIHPLFLPAREIGTAMSCLRRHVSVQVKGLGCLGIIADPEVLPGHLKPTLLFLFLVLITTA